jgi:hypothetical protein
MQEEGSGAINHRSKVEGWSRSAVSNADLTIAKQLIRNTNNIPVFIPRDISEEGLRFFIRHEAIFL